MMESTYARDGIQEHISPGAEVSPRGPLPQVLWQQFVTAKTPASYCQSWLALQCRVIPGVSAGMVMLQGAPVAFWPDVPQEPQFLTDAAAQAGREGRPVVFKRALPGPQETPQERYFLAYPLQVERHVQSIIAFDMVPRSAPNSKQSCGTCSGALPGSPCSCSDRPCRARRRRGLYWNCWQRFSNTLVRRRRDWRVIE